MSREPLKGLDMLKTRLELKQKLWENVNALQNGLKESGFDIGTTSSCVTPVYLNGSIPEAMALVKGFAGKLRYLLFNCCLSGYSQRHDPTADDTYLNTYHGRY